MFLFLALLFLYIIQLIYVKYSLKIKKFYIKFPLKILNLMSILIFWILLTPGI